MTPEKLIERHHLVPASKHEKNKKTIFVCVSCGDMLHQLFNNKQLAKQFDSLEKILYNEKVQKWIKWIQKKPNDFNICMKRKK